MKQFADQLQSKLKKLQSRGVLQQFRITVTETQSTEAGATQNDFCGGYHPITTEETLSGNYLFQWPDGKLSKGNLTRQSLAKFDEFITEAKAVAFEDPFGDNFPEAEPHPKIKVASEKVAETAKNPTPWLTAWLQTLKAWQAEANPIGAQHIKATVGVSHSRTFSSAGFDLETQETSNGLLSIYNETAGFGHSSHQILDPDFINQKRKRAEHLFKVLNQPIERLPRPGKYPVIFDPSVLRGLFFEMFLSNLSGTAVIKGQSKFDLGDFKRRKTVLRPDITITCDPTQNGKLGSYNFTGEGILSRKEVFIKEGRLITPILGAKYARKAEMEPTARIHPAMDTTTIKANSIQDFDKFIGEQDKVLLIHEALGMHGQDPITGSYSLPCPYAIWIENGEMLGNAPCTVTGNFFTDLNNPEAVFLTHPTEYPPALATEANVVFI